MSFEWSEDLSVGIDFIDSQHRELISRINKLLDAMKAGRGKEEIAKIMDFLSFYVAKHFKDEENYMKKYDYPEYDDHKEKHVLFVKGYNELKGSMANKIDSLFAIKFQKFLCDWLKDHIMNTDRIFGVFITEKRKIEN